MQISRRPQECWLPSPPHSASTRMSARRMTLPVLAVCLVALAGCQSMFREDMKARAQSPAGLGGGIPKPPPPPKAKQPGDPTEEDETLFEQISGTVDGYFKPDPDAEKAKTLFAEADQKFLAKEYSGALPLYQQAGDLAPRSFV